MVKPLQIIPKILTEEDFLLACARRDIQTVETYLKQDKPNINAFDSEGGALHKAIINYPEDDSSFENLVVL